jgi:ABC-type antimicrobial peptide transport system permease subunit
VVAHAVGQRTQEIGLRIALGAKRIDILGMVLSGGGKLLATGIGLGTVASIVITRLMASQVSGVQPADPLTFAVVALVLAIVALVACYVPARRASKVDPIVALRYE